MEKAALAAFSFFGDAEVPQTRQSRIHSHASSLFVKEMLQIDQRLIINASEVGEFVYCAKAWYLKRCGEVPKGSQLDKGAVFHKEHGTTVLRAARLRKAGAWLSLAGLFLLVVLALRWFAR